MKKAPHPISVRMRRSGIAMSQGDYIVDSLLCPSQLGQVFDASAGAPLMLEAQRLHLLPQCAHGAGVVFKVSEVLPEFGDDVSQRSPLPLMLILGRFKIGVDHGPEPVFQ